MLRAHLPTELQQPQQARSTVEKLAASTTLEQGRRTLLKPFVHWLGLRDVRDVGSLQIEEQRIPGSTIATHSEIEG